MFVAYGRVATDINTVDACWLGFVCLFLERHGLALLGCMSRTFRQRSTKTKGRSSTPGSRTGRPGV